MEAISCKCVEYNVENSTQQFGRFVFKPLDYGHGITIGNLFRRVLLTSLVGLTITGVKIVGVNQEFSTIPGVREDILEILLNLKDVILKGNSENAKPETGRLKIQGPAIVTASCFEFSSNVEIINPNHYIASISDNSILEMEVKLEYGKGYKLADKQKKGINEFLLVDAIFRPVKLVNFTVESIIHEIDSESLILDIYTNGSITPQQAINEATQIIINWFQSIQYLGNQSNTQSLEIEIEDDLEAKRQDVMVIPIEDLCLSVRACNSLKRFNINTIGDLLNYSISDLKEIKNFGQKSLDEVQEKVKTLYDISLT